MIPVSVIGLGYWGPNLVRNVATSEKTRLVGLCDVDEDRLTSIGSTYPSARTFHSASALLSDAETSAVIVATPVRTHYEIAKAALEAGKHVLVEKPLATKSSEASELIDLARRRDRVLMVDHVFVYSSAVETLVRLTVSGELGDIQFVDSVRINLGLLQPDIDVMWDLAPHDLSIIDALIGRAPRSVVAVGAQVTSDNVADMAYVHLDYGEDLMASLHVNWLSPVKVRHFMIGGSRRSVLYNDLDRSEPVKIYDRGIEVDANPDDRRSILVSYRSGDVVSPRVQPTEPLRAMIEHFADCVRGGLDPITGGIQGLRIVKTLEAASESLKLGGRAIDVDG